MHPLYSDPTDSIVFGLQLELEQALLMMMNFKSFFTHAQTKNLPQKV